jgi:hypothetical protein
VVCRKRKAENVQAAAILKLAVPPAPTFIFVEGVSLQRQVALTGVAATCPDSLNNMTK